MTAGSGWAWWRERRLPAEDLSRLCQALLILGWLTAWPPEQRQDRGPQQGDALAVG